VSFGAPDILVGLLAIPALVGLYLSHQRGRARAAAAFASPRLTASVSPQRPGWRRHAPMLIFLLALAILVLAAARPQKTVAVPINRASIMLLNDVSGSMLATDVQPNRLDAARSAAKRFVQNVPRNVNVGVMAFNGKPRVLQSPTTDRIAVDAALDQLAPSGGTATGRAMQQALAILRRAPGEGGKRPPAAIVLISDGASTSGADPVAVAQEARKLKIPVYTVALGTANGTITVPRPGGRGGTETHKVPPDARSLARVAQTSGGRAYTAADEDRLKQVYERLGSQLGRKNAKREITAGFAGGGLALLLLGAGLSLAWFGRVI
jgi:Ca-activated chloride channel homolog